MRADHALQAEDVRCRPAEHEEGFGVFAELRANSRYRFSGVGISAVRRDVPDIRGGQRIENFGMDSRPVVTREGARRRLLSCHAPTITRAALKRQADANIGGGSSES